jgi:hypothetical protein
MMKKCNDNERSAIWIVARLRHPSQSTTFQITRFQKQNDADAQKITTMSSPPYALEIDPESSLQFTITRDPPSSTSSSDGGESAGASRCTMTLRHTGKTNENLAFKVSFNVEFSLNI